MTGFDFPNIFKGNAVNILTGKESAISQFTLLINSEVFEFRYDPGYGSNIPLLRFKPDTPLNRDLIVDAIYDGQMFCPNIRFTRESVTIRKTESGTLEISVPAIIDTATYFTDVVLYVEATT